MSDDLSLKQLVELISDKRSVDFRGYKHSTLDRRLRKRMFALDIGSYGRYLERIRQDPTELAELLNTVLINVTEFLRDPQAWEFIRTSVLPPFFQRLKPGDSFRAWCAGCASGEEPYSLALLVAEALGDRIGEYDIKIYATDIDEQALNTARRGEYPIERLRRLRPFWREKYFQGSGSLLKIRRDVRRLVIFGRSNLMNDAPISHCDLVICRNVLIYFDPPAQEQILARLQYALPPGGVLFLGKAEPKLSQADIFRPINPRWRIFKRVTPNHVDIPETACKEDTMSDSMSINPAQHELDEIKTCQRYLLETLKSGVILLDANDVVINNNDAATKIWAIAGVRIAGKRLQDTELMIRCPELSARLESTRQSVDLVRFECRPSLEGEEHTISVTLRPVIADGGTRTGTLIYAEDVTHHEKLQNTVEQLESTGEELQSANEELETTNEELQSTNEELETTNEELQSTNEELETTNEELQSLNEELENMNEELEARTRELNALTTRYAETLQRMPWPVVLVDSEEKIQLWNAAAQKLFGIGATSVVGVDLDQLPLQDPMRRAIIRRCQTVLQSGKQSILRGQSFRIEGIVGELDVYYTPIARNSSIEGVLMMFGPLAPGDLPAREISRIPPVKKPASRTAKMPARKPAVKATPKRKQVTAKRTPRQKR